MRVLIDATSVLLRSAGIKSYTYHWIEHLRRVAGEDEIRAFPMLNELGALQHERSVLTPWSTYPRLALLYFVNAQWNRTIDVLTASADLFHVSNQIRNPPRKTRLTATLHDLTCWLMPELHTAGNVRADKSFADEVLKRAAGLIAVSENTKRDAVRVLGIAESRIDVIYSGVGDAYFDARAVEDRAAKPYVLFVGTIEPRKNVDTLLDAWHLLKPDVRERFELVIAGATGWSSERTVARLRSGVGGIRYRGYVAESELPVLTAGATAFVYPSLYEGFGFPVAQAMACGVPVITSNNSCLPEIAGDGAVLVDPRSPLELAGAIEHVVTSASLREKLSAAGRLQAQQYRWDECARRSMQFFRRLA
jgi:glycosyltransferase involved in cell wall biosynthesis